jgi:hypothetical protein
MGAISFSIPKDIVTKLSVAEEYKYFVETGTYMGGTCFWAATIFPEVLTIEIDPAISKRTATDPQCPKNIKFYIGDSGTLMPEVVKEINDKKALFWLDGHWCNVSEFGRENECPIIKELEAISELTNPTILIDDARAFLGPLPPPHDPQQWPTIQDIFFKVKELFPKHYMTLQDDVIFIIPNYLKHVLDEDWIKNYQDRYFPKKPEPIKRSLLTRVICKLKSI